jgi:hypothetical protein
VFNELDTYAMSEVLTAVRHVRQHYPQIIEINPGMFGDMERIAAEHAGPAGPESVPRLTASDESSPRHAPSLPNTRSARMWGRLVLWALVVLGVFAALLLWYLRSG